MSYRKKLSHFEGYPMKSSRFVLFLLVALLISVPLSAQERPVGLPQPETGVTIRATDAIVNGGFETDSDWTETSLTFPGDIICFAACTTGGGTAGPYTGLGWVWFGGGSQEASTLMQTLSLTPAVGTTDVLRFWLWNGTTARGADRFYTRFNNLQLLEVAEGDAPFTLGYSEVLLNLAGIPGGTLSFAATSMDGATTNFSLDDVSLVPNVQDLVVNGSFEDLVNPLLSWTTPGKSGDLVICTDSTSFGNCTYKFKGSRFESSRLRQNLQLPIGAVMSANSTLVGSFWANAEPGVVLNAKLKVTYINGTQKTVKLNARFNAKYDDSAAGNDTNREWKLYQLPPLLLSLDSVSAAVLTLTHKSSKSNITVNVDNFSVAYLPAP